MRHIVDKLNRLQELDETFFNEFLQFIIDSRLRPDNYINQLLNVNSPIGLLYIAKGFEYFLPSSKLDNDEFDISDFINNMPKDVRNKDIVMIQKILAYNHKVRQKNNLPLNHGMMIASHNFAFNYSGINLEVFVPWIIQYFESAGMVMHSPILSAYDIEEQDEIILDLKVHENLPKAIVYIFQLLYFFMGKEQAHNVFNLIKSNYDPNLVDIESFWLDDEVLKRLSYNNPFNSFLALYSHLKNKHSYKLSFQYLFV